MQLSDYDLKQLDDERIRSLSAETLRTLSSKLLADLKEARDRLNQNPDNSSRPPSTRAPWEGKGDEAEEPEQEPEESGQDREDEAPADGPSAGADDEKDAQQGNRKPKQDKTGKPGKPKGSPGHGRTVELAVTAERTHRPHACALCAQAIPPDAPRRGHNGRYEIDLVRPSSGAPGLEVSHTLHRYLECQCGCGHWTRAEPGRCPDEAGWTIELTEWHVVGPELASLMCS